MKNSTKYRFFTVILTLIILASLNIFAQSDYQAGIQKWREKKENDLKSDNGWLTLTNLAWLKEGINTIGSAANNNIVLPKPTAQQIGIIEFKQGKANLSISEGVDVLGDGRKISSIELKSDAEGKPTLVQIGEVSFTLIKREDRYGIRVRDVNSLNRAKFTNLHWFPVDESYRVTADFEAYDTPKEIEIPNVLGGTFKMKSPGLLKFRLGGESYSLEPVEEGDEYFIIFSDLTNRTTTYQPGRFLYSAKAKNGKVVLDFNQAYNPPCAFTEYATCPLPPAQNRLKTEIKAGEMRYDH
jgi:uncharacterized protein